VESCFARQAFRYFGATRSEASETAFLSLRETLEESSRYSIVELLIAYAESDLFAERGDLP
jgi:hypothetical protein